MNMLIYTLFTTATLYYHASILNQCTAHILVRKDSFILHFISFIWTGKYHYIISSVNFSNLCRPPHLYILSQLVSYRPSAP